MWTIVLMITYTFRILFDHPFRRDQMENAVMSPAVLTDGEDLIRRRRLLEQALRSVGRGS